MKLGSCRAGAWSGKDGLHSRPEQTTTGSSRKRYEAVVEANSGGAVVLISDEYKVRVSRAKTGHDMSQWARLTL